MNWKFWQKKNSDNKAEEHSIVIPEPIKDIEEFKVNIADHDKFNVIINVDGTMWRIRNEQSHEVVRMVCKFHDRKIKSISVGDSYLHYTGSISESSFVRRLFVTNNGNFFYQDIYANGYVKYFSIDKYRVHHDMSIWENPNRKEINLTHTDGYVCGNYLIPTGTYDNKNDAIDFGKYTHDLETFFDSYEIIDQERYDKLIDVL